MAPVLHRLAQLRGMSGGPIRAPASGRLSPPFPLRPFFSDPPFRICSMSYVPGAYYKAAGAVAPRPESPRPKNERVLPLVKCPRLASFRNPVGEKARCWTSEKGGGRARKRNQGSGTPSLLRSAALDNTIKEDYHVQEYSQEWATHLLTALKDGLNDWKADTSAKDVVSGLFQRPMLLSQHRSPC